MDDPNRHRDIRLLVAKVPYWYHSIDLGQGVVTPGEWDHRPYLHYYGLPERLAGQRVLDVGTMDGFWAFELERRGSREVVAIDIASPDERDLPPPVRQRMQQPGSATPLGQGFKLAQSLLKSEVNHRTLNLYSLSAGQIGQFDFVFCGDVLIHLTDPIRALWNIRQVSRGVVIFAEPVADEVKPIGKRHLAVYHGDCTTFCTWWVPGRNTLGEMLRDAGFGRVELISTFDMPMPYGAEGEMRRAVYRACA